MGFIALIFALLIEQGRPLPPRNFVHRWIVQAADALMIATNAGRRRQGAFGWFVLVGGLVAGTVGLQWAASLVHPLAVLVVHVVVLYLTIGFRQFSHAFSEIQLALAAGDPNGAREALQRWFRTIDPEYVARDMPIEEVCRQAISQALVDAHRHVFGPLFWYILLPGPVGPVMYRAAELLARRWQQPGERYGEFARDAFQFIDWLPLRMTATGFAIVGNFEDSVYCWRGAVATDTAEDPRALLLAAGGGAIGVRVADPELEARWSSADRGFDWQGGEPDASGLRSAVGLVWRSVILWISLFALLTMAAWLGQ